MIKSNNLSSFTGRVFFGPCLVNSRRGCSKAENPALRELREKVRVLSERIEDAEKQRNIHFNWFGFTACGVIGTFAFGANHIDSKINDTKSDLIDRISSSESGLKDRISNLESHLEKAMATMERNILARMDLDNRVAKMEKR